MVCCEMLVGDVDVEIIGDDMSFVEVVLTILLETDEAQAGFGL